MKHSELTRIDYEIDFRQKHIFKGLGSSNISHKGPTLLGLCCVGVFDCNVPEPATSFIVFVCLNSQAET